MKSQRTHNPQRKPVYRAGLRGAEWDNPSGLPALPSRAGVENSRAGWGWDSREQWPKSKGTRETFNNVS